jgi:hypothetical protein
MGLCRCFDYPAAAPPVGRKTPVDNCCNESV